MYMKTKWFAVIAALNLVFGMTARAQGEVSGSVADAIDLEVIVEASGDKPQKPEKPERPERPKKEGAAVKELAVEFRTKMAEFHAEQKELVKKLKSATEAERADIREQLKSNREEFQSVKEEFRDSVKDLSGTLKDHATKISAETKAESKGRKQR